MSTIVYRDGVMAADSRAYSGNSSPIGHKMKIRRLSDGSLVGVSTCKPGLSEAFMKWLEDGADVDHGLYGDIDLAALVVRPNGEVYYYFDGLYPSGPLIAPWFAVGSGERYAMGALEMGADAVRAAEVAAVLDTMSAPPVTALELRPAPVTVDAPSEAVDGPVEASEASEPDAAAGLQ